MRLRAEEPGESKKAARSTLNTLDWFFNRDTIFPRAKAAISRVAEVLSGEVSARGALSATLHVLRGKVQATASVAADLIASGTVKASAALSAVRGTLRAGAVKVQSSVVGRVTTQGAVDGQVSILDVHSTLQTTVQGQGDVVVRGDLTVPEARAQAGVVGVPRPRSRVDAQASLADVQGTLDATVQGKASLATQGDLTPPTVQGQASLPRTSGDLTPTTVNGKASLATRGDLTTPAVQGQASPTATPRPNPKAQATGKIVRVEITSKQDLAVKDCMVPQSSTDTANHDGEDLQCDRGTGLLDKASYVAWDLSGLPANATVLSATLHLYRKDTNSANQLDASNIPDTGEDWDETTITYSNQPGAGNVSVTVYPSTGRGEKSLGLQEAAMLDDIETHLGDTSFTLFLHNVATQNQDGTVSASGEMTFDSKDEGSNDSLGPRLTLKLEVPP